MPRGLKCRQDAWIRNNASENAPPTIIGRIRIISNPLSAKTAREDLGTQRNDAIDLRHHKTRWLHRWHIQG